MCKKEDEKTIIIKNLNLVQKTKYLKIVKAYSNYFSLLLIKELFLFFTFISVAGGVL